MRMSLAAGLLSTMLHRTATDPVLRVAIRTYYNPIIYLFVNDNHEDSQSEHSPLVRYDGFLRLKII